MSLKVRMQIDFLRKDHYGKACLRRLTGGGLASSDPRAPDGSEIPT